MSDQRTIYIHEVADVINELVDTWTTEVVLAVEDAQNSTIEGAKRYIKKETSKLYYGGKKPYIDCYTNKKVGQHTRALWNRKYALSHLLEDGHASYNQFGGPYEVKNRVPDTTANKNAKRTSSSLTTRYDSYDETLEDYVKESYIKFIRKKVGGIKI